MKIKGADFRKALSCIKDARPRVTTLPQLYSTRVAAEEGFCSFACTDLEAWAWHKVPCKGDLSGCAIDSRILNDIADHCGDSVVEIVENGPGRVNINYGQSKLTTSVLGPDEIPSPEPQDHSQLAVNTSDLAEALEAVIFAANPKADDYKIQSLYLELNENLLAVTAADRKVMASFRQPAICGKASCLIPAQKARGLAQALMLKQPSVTLSQNYICAQHAAGAFTARLIEGEYFPVAILLAQVTKPIGKLMPESLLAQLHFIERLSEAGYAPGHVQFYPDRLWIGFQDKVRSFEAELPGAFAVCQFRADVFLLARTLANLGKDPVQVDFAENSLFFRSGNLIAAVALIAGKAPEPS